MRITTGKYVYLQKYEIAFIMHDLNSFPSGILDEVFSGCENGFFYINSPADSFQFKCVFKNPTNIKWLMDQDWLIDYDEYAKMPLSELESLVEQLKVEHIAKIDEFNAKDETYRKSHFAEMNDKLNKESHKLHSLVTLISALKGEIEFTFPEGYRNKTVTNSHDSSYTTDIIIIPKKKPSIFERLFSHSAQ